MANDPHPSEKPHHNTIGEHEYDHDERSNTQHQYL